MVFSNFGLIAIMLWGLAYVAVSRAYHLVPYLVMVFALEKFVYAMIWIVWMSRSAERLPGVLSDAPMTGIFFYTYGLVDFLFGVFFAWVAFTTLRQRTSTPEG